MPGITIEEFCAVLAERGHAVGCDTIHRLPKRPRAWFDALPHLDPVRLVFIDKTWTKTNMACTHRPCWHGERPPMGMLHAQWRITTCASVLTLRGMIAPFALSNPVNRDAFEAYVEQAPPRATPRRHRRVRQSPNP